MVRRSVALVASAVLAIGLASATFAADPTAARGHGAEVSAVAKAVHAVQGNAHGKAVSAIAKTHGKEVSAAARARAAAKHAAGQGNGNANASGKANAGGAKANANARDQEEDAPTLEIGRVKVERSTGS
jgi:hypothetical protein